MNLHPRTRRIAFILGALLVVVAVAFGAVMIVLVRAAPPAEPTITAYSYGRAGPVPPLRYCSIDLTACSTGATVDLEVPAGQPLQLSLPDAIAAAPWHLITVHQRADGTVVTTDRQYRTGEATAVTVESSRDLQLNGVEIQLPSAAVDRAGLPIARAVWSIKTA